MTKDELIAHLENILGSAKHLLEGANSIEDPASIPAGSPEGDAAVGTSSSTPPGGPVEQDIVKPPEGSVQDEPEGTEAAPETPQGTDTAGDTEAPPAVQSATPEEIQAAAALMRQAGYRVTPGDAAQ